MHPVTNVRLRPKGDYINIDMHGNEVGPLHLDEDGSVRHRWAYDHRRRWLIDLVAQTYEFAHAITADATSPATTSIRERPRNAGGRKPQ